MTTELEGLLVHELVGDLSEGILLCSYNEDDVREIWQRGGINESIEELDVWEKSRCMQMLEHWPVQNGDYQKLLTDLVVLAGGWPRGWSSLPEDLAPLGKKDYAIIDAK